MNLPACLTERPLVFGDREQIGAIKELKRVAEEQAEAEAEGKRVYLEFELSPAVVEVTAKDKDEARLLAEGELCVDEWDKDFVTVNVKGE